jgi:hypothetical protein
MTLAINTVWDKKKDLAAEFENLRNSEAKLAAGDSAVAASSTKTKQTAESNSLTKSGNTPTGSRCSSTVQGETCNKCRYWVVSNAIVELKMDGRVLPSFCWNE